MRHSRYIIMIFLFACITQALPAQQGVLTPETPVDSFFQVQVYKNRPREDKLYWMDVWQGKPGVEWQLFTGAQKGFEFEGGQSDDVVNGWISLLFPEQGFWVRVRPDLLEKRETLGFYIGKKLLRPFENPEVWRREFPDYRKANATPNPFYAYMETGEKAKPAEITFRNLYPGATLRIYTLKGDLIREEIASETDWKWDLKNAKDVPCASGVYIVHISGHGFFEQVLKVFFMIPNHDGPTPF